MLDPAGNIDRLGSCGEESQRLVAVNAHSQRDYWSQMAIRLSASQFPHEPVRSTSVMVVGAAVTSASLSARMSAAIRIANYTHHGIGELR
jgi:hypothetical protein